MIQTYILDNGLRIVASPSATDVVYCGIAVDAGTRDELPGEEGIAHFTEHLSFKGTTHRKAWHILNRMETVGGDLNAFTGKEETVYYSTFLRPHFARAVDLLVDVVFNSVYPQQEMDKEVEVVIDEIESYNDSPADLIFDEFENNIFQGHALGHAILGEADGLRRMKSADVQRFVNRLYRPDRMVLYVLGNIPMKQIVREVQKALRRSELLRDFDSSNLPHFESSSQRGNASPVQLLLRQPPTVYTPSHQVAHKDTHQAHVMMGVRSFSATDPRHLHLYVLNNMLGGPGMNSRLNLALRERNGLVYTVESASVCYTDTGLWTVYFGCDPHDVKRCQKLVLRELDKLTSAPLSSSALATVKRQLIGQIGISYDSFESMAINMGKRYLHYNTTQTCEQLCQRVNDLTADDLYRTACQLFVPENISTLVYEQYN
ncbi:MAG: insulinase family protein [Bacteroidales bacterium]|nr:insulinase family protein [Bacteroidales bacterium]